jgi:hypothetical protein
MNSASHLPRTRTIPFVIVCSLLLAGVGMLAAKTRTDGALQAARPGREFKLRAGQQVTLRGTRLRIKFVRVESDSRCPADVKCVWAGNAAVQFRLSSGRESKTLTLNSSPGEMFVKEGEYQGYKVTLVDLSPYPRSDRRITVRDWVVTLLVSKK